MDRAGVSVLGVGAGRSRDFSRSSRVEAGGVAGGVRAGGVRAGGPERTRRSSMMFFSEVGADGASRSRSSSSVGILGFSRNTPSIHCVLS